MQIGTFKAGKMRQQENRLRSIVPTLTIALVIAMGISIPSAQARVVSEQFIENGKPITVLQNIRDTDGVVEGVAISGPNGLEIRVDEDGDGAADWRRFESGEYEIEYSWPAGGVFYKMMVVRRAPKERIEALFFLSQDRKNYELWKLEKRPYEVMYAPKMAASKTKKMLPATAVRQVALESEGASEGADGAFCSLKNIASPSDPSWRRFADVLEAKAIEDSTGIRKLVSPSCSKEHSDLILRGMTQLLSSSNRGERKLYFACLADYDGMKEEATTLQLKYWSYIYQAKKSPIFQCSRDIPPNKLAEFQEQGPQRDRTAPPIRISPLLLDAVDSPDQVAAVLFHELIHSTNLRDEKRVRSIERCCLPGVASKSQSCSQATMSNQFDIRIAKVDGLSELVKLAAANSSEKGDEARDIIIKELDEQSGRFVCASKRSKSPDAACIGTIKSSIENVYKQITIKICGSQRLIEQCEETKKRLNAGLAREIDRCLQHDVGNLCQGSKRLGFGRNQLNITGFDLAIEDQVNDEKSGQSAEPLRRGSIQSAGAAPAMRYEPIKGDDTRAMRVAANTSQSILPRAVAQVRERIERINTDLIPRAEARTLRSVRVRAQSNEGMNFKSLESSDRPYVRLTNGESIRLVQAFDINAGISPVRSNRKPADSLRDSSGSPPILSVGGGRDTGAHAKVGGRSNASSGGDQRRRSMNHSDEIKDSRVGHNLQRSIASTKAESRGQPRPRSVIRNQSDALRMLKEASDPEKLAGEAWFEERLRDKDLLIQLIGEKRIYGTKSQSPRVKWDLRMFKSEVSR